MLSILHLIRLSILTLKIIERLNIGNKLSLLIIDVYIRGQLCSNAV